MAGTSRCRFGWILVLLVQPIASAQDEVDFNRDIRPILSDHCFACHGPDAEVRQADLRLDSAEGLRGVVDRDEPEQSELIARIESTDDDLVMPPPDASKPLSAAQKKLLRRWVAQGAAVGEHWAFVAPQRPSLPESVESAIDYFVDRRALRAGLKVNSSADRRTLLRRLCLDLTGLPPSRNQLEEFLSDSSDEAYENLVDRLLESEQFGPHVGRYWLDLVRYADTHGLHLDNYREVWPYRDWVIEAFNSNLPFDQFIRHQLAGDLIPNATRDQLIASGFNRLNVTTNEGGSIYDEVFVRNCIDRTDAFGTIFLGLTTGCAVCHDHKFDPISQRDYYSLLAYFNSLDGRAMDGNRKDHQPVIKVPSEQQTGQLAEYKSILKQLVAEQDQPIESVDAAQRNWERSVLRLEPNRCETLIASRATSDAGVEMEVRSDGRIELVGQPSAKDTTQIVATLPPGKFWQTLRLEAIAESDQRVGVSSNGNVVLSEIRVELRDSLSAGEWIAIPAAYARADVEQADGDFDVSYAIDGKLEAKQGWGADGHRQTGSRTAWFHLPGLMGAGDQAELRITLEYQSEFAQHQFRSLRLCVLDSAPPVPPEDQVRFGESHVVGPMSTPSPNLAYQAKHASHEGAFKADEVFKRGQREFRWQHRADLRRADTVRLPNLIDQSSIVVLHQAIVSPKKRSAELLVDNDGGYVAYLNGKQIGVDRGNSPLGDDLKSHEIELREGDNDLYIKVINYGGKSRFSFAVRGCDVAADDRILQLASIPESERTSQQREQLRCYFRRIHCQHPDYQALIDQTKGTRKARDELRKQVPTTLVWKELAEPRTAHVLVRGQYDNRGDEVVRSTPAFLNPMPTDASSDRLGLADWLTSPQNPLTARVAVNRFWQQLFGTGLVKTSEDFGNQGERPSHPDLLDWLAVDFRESGWDVKRLFKNIVMSRTYQRSYHVDPESQRIDPENRLLARGARQRLDAEVLRDQALSLSGQLVDRTGGASVKPPQPKGLWTAVGYTGSDTQIFHPDKGDQILRRSVYTFWKRTSPPPQMSTLDAPSREACTARRERTNTPLQALLMMNETQYVQAAKQLAERVLQQSNLASDPERVDWLFETATARRPSESERSELVTLLDDLMGMYRTTRDNQADDDDPRRAAWTVLASTVLNLDEVVTK